MVRLPGHSEGGRVSFHFIPHPRQSVSPRLGMSADGCGWVEHNDRFEHVRLGTLLGPEETP